MAKVSWQPDLKALLNRMDVASENASKAGAACLNAGADYLYTEFEAGLARHRKRGKAMESLVKKEPMREGHVYTLEVGSFYDEGKRPGFLHAIYQEYGTPTFPKDPWMRPVQDRAKRELTNIYREIVKEIMGQ